MIDVREVYDAWAPREAFWSRWVKPVLFAKLEPGDLVGAGPIVAQDAAWAPLGRDTALVIDLPGERSVAMGLALVERGYRPVPLFNGVPSLNALVMTQAISRDLVAGAAELRGRALSPEAPPAFLLDSARSGGGRVVAPGAFDNRWCVLVQDLPSAALLVDRGIRKLILFNELETSVIGDRSVADDLAHVLRRFQEAGLPIARMSPGALSATPITVAAPPAYRSLWYRFQVLAGLRRNSTGGFGDVVPLPSASGGFG